MRLLTDPVYQKGRIHIILTVFPRILDQYLTTVLFECNNTDIVVSFISSAASNSTARHFATPGITANYCVPMIISLIAFEL